MVLVEMRFKKRNEDIEGDYKEPMTMVYGNVAAAMKSILEREAVEYSLFQTLDDFIIDHMPVRVLNNGGLLLHNRGI